MAVTRRLAAIFAADMAGYSRLMEADEEGTHAALQGIRRKIVDPNIAGHHGRIVKTTGDGLLAEFASVVDAVRCAVEVQRAMARHNADVPVDRRVEFRIGINVGDIIIDADDIYGDGVNIAARLEAIITALSRIRWLFVIARNSSFSYKGQSPDVRQVGRELGVRYVLEGSVRKAGGRVRIMGQLIDATTRAHLWADRFDGSLEDVFDLQDKVASSVAGIIEPELQAAETARSAGRPTSDLTTYDLYLRAYAMFVSSARQIPEALDLLEQAIARDPRYGPALAWAAICCLRLLLDGRSKDPAADRLKGADFARRALEAAGDDPGVLASAAFALGYFGEDIGTMMALVDRALALNPNYARGWHLSGVLRLWAGQPDIAIEHAETSWHLSPRTRIGTSLLTIGVAHFLSRRFGDAVPKLLLAIQDNPGHPEPYRFLAACYAHMGRLDDARETVARLRTIASVVIEDASYLRNAEQRELYQSGLRLAAGEAG